MNKPIQIIMLFIRVFVLLVWVSCSLHKPQVKADNFLPTIPYSDGGVHYYMRRQPVLGDTARVKKKVYVTQDQIKKFFERSDQAYSNIGTIKDLLALNIEWQKRTQRAQDSSRIRGKRVDSTKALLRVMLDTMNIANRRADMANSRAEMWHKEAQNKEIAERQNQTINSSINWQFWTAFIVVVALLLANLYMTKRINGKPTNLTTL
jgi:hypothetical protein